MDVLVSAVTGTRYERCDSLIPQGGRTYETAAFNNVPIDLVAVFCDTGPHVWRIIVVKFTKHASSVVCHHHYGRLFASIVCVHEKRVDPPKFWKFESSICAEPAHARVEQHKRRESFNWVRLTGNGDIVTIILPFTVEVMETPREKR
jgi:hypothetical protein